MSPSTRVGKRTQVKGEGGIVGESRYDQMKEATNTHGVVCVLEEVCVGD